jgi:two-component system, cell cycle sensor histidine kinase and response regulator CckA
LRLPTVEELKSLLQALKDSVKRRPYDSLPGFILLITAVTLAIGVISLSYVETRLVMTTGESLALAAADITDKLDRILQERQNDTLKMAKAFRERDVAAIDQYLKWMHRTFPSYRWLAVTDAQGRIVSATDPSSLGKNMSRKPWFQAARRQHGVYVQDAQISEESGGIPAVSFTVAIKGSNNEFLGTVTTRVGLASLEDVFLSTVEAFHVQKGASGRIEYQFLTRDGEVFADSILRQEGKVNLKHLGLPSALLSGSGQSGFIEEMHERRRLPVVTGYAQSKGYGEFLGLHWVVLVRMDRGDILRPVRSVLWKLGMAGIIVWLPMFLGLLWTTRRLRREWTKTRESEEWLSTTLMSIGDGVIATDDQGRVVSMNAVARSLTGWREAEAKGRLLHETFNILDEETRQAVENVVPRILREGLTIGVTNHTVLLSKDGTERSIETSGAPIRDANGRTIGVILIFRDITKRREAELALRRSEEQLRQSQKIEAIGKLAGGVAHDFNNYLTAIMGYGELLTGVLNDAHPARKSADEIMKAASRAASLTRQLLAFSRKQVVQSKVLDLNAITSGLEPMLQRLMGEDVELVIVKDPALGSVKGDLGQIEQVIMNLAVNGRDAMPQGGKLTIETANVSRDEVVIRDNAELAADHYVMLAVSDTGSGIDPKIQAQLFEPFFTTKEKGKGTGLGLSTVYGIVKQSGGNIEVHSELLRGSTFRIYLPRIDEPATPVERSESSPQRLEGSETVLLVEDEDAVRRLAYEVLQRHGYRVLEARNSEDAFRVDARHDSPIHLMVTDVMVPGMSGRELAERLLSSRPNMKVLYMSGHTDDAIVRYGVLGEKMAFLQKPFTPTVFLQKVREVIDNQPLLSNCDAHIQRTEASKPNPQTSVVPVLPGSGRLTS